MPGGRLRAAAGVGVAAAGVFVALAASGREPWLLAAAATALVAAVGMRGIDRAFASAVPPTGRRGRLAGASLGFAGCALALGVAWDWRLDSACTPLGVFGVVWLLLLAIAYGLAWRRTDPRGRARRGS